MDLALQLTIASSEQSSKFGNYMLGFFISGLGNIDEALSMKYGMKAKRETKLDTFYLSAASDQGLVEGRNELAYHLQHKEASRDRERAFHLYSQAASFGHPGANESVGYFLMRGVGATMDRVAAERYLNIAAEAGCLGALRLLLELGDPSRDVSIDMVRARFDAICCYSQFSMILNMSCLKQGEILSRTTQLHAGRQSFLGRLDAHVIPSTRFGGLLF
jgi:hypothetical protein